MSPFLKIGITFAVLRQEGKIPSSIASLIRGFNILAKCVRDEREKLTEREKHRLRIEIIVSGMATFTNMYFKRRLFDTSKDEYQFSKVIADKFAECFST